MLIYKCSSCAGDHSIRDDRIITQNNERYFHCPDTGDRVYISEVKTNIDIILEDKLGQRIKNGSIIDIHQTVNGCNTFLVNNLIKDDIRYFPDINRKYEYSVDELLDRNTFDKTVEVIGFLNKNRLKHYCL